MDYWTDIRKTSQKDSKTCIIHRQHPQLCKPRGKSKDRYHCMFEAVKLWCDGCLENHSRCSKSILPEENSSLVPTRLIDVGSLDPPREPRLVKYRDMAVLLQATQSALYPGYATLSYRWGQNCVTDFVLRADNEAELLRVIPSASLPRTISDAIHICQRIGIQCLWIDALCIKQATDGQSPDWQEESARVGIYYHNALLTIADTWALSNDEGCLPQSRWRDQQPVFWRYTKELANAIGYAVFLGDVKSLSKIDGRGLERQYRAWAEIEFCELLKRGWVAQEIAFSSRILWFSKTGVFWQCKEESKADRGGTFKHKTITPLSTEYLEVSSSAQSVTPSESHALWYRIVQHYAGMALSDEEDRLPAISGLCKYFDAHNKDQYLAGIWRSSLIYGLSWFLRGVPVDSGNICRFPQKENTPSWSWISRPDQIELRPSLECHKGDCEVASFGLNVADVRLQYSDVHGRIVHASIQVQAPMQRLEIECVRGDYWRHIKAPTTNSSWRLSSFNVRFDDAPFGNSSEPFDPWVGAAVLLSHSCQEGRTAMNLLLVEPMDGQVSTYRRAGIMWMGTSSIDTQGLGIFGLAQKNFGQESVQQIRLI